MIKNNNSSFMKLFKLKKYKDLFDFKSLECKIALVSAIIIDILCYIGTQFTTTDNIMAECIKYLDSIGIALIGFLGFVVTGLAILTGSISSKIVQLFKKRNKFSQLEKILLSFYLLGLISAFIIVFTFIIHFFSLISIPSILFIDLVILFIMTYLIVFVVFYAARLVGDCLELFYIVNDIQLIIDAEATSNLKTEYNNYRITALEKIILEKGDLEQIQEYKRTIENLITSDNISDEKRSLYLNLYNNHFKEP